MRRPTGAAARWLATFALLAVVASGMAIAVLGAGGPSERLTPSSRAGFPDWFAGPLAPLAPDRLSDTGFWALLAAMGAGYLAVLWLVRSAATRLVVAAILVLHLAFALAPPLLSTDAFGYVGVARMLGEPGLGPYGPMSETLRGDPLVPFLVWDTRPNPYGPLFTAASYPLAALAVPAGLWTVKAAMAAAGLALVALTARTARHVGEDPVLAAAFVGLNPVLLAWAVGGAHNDLLLMVLVVGAIALLAAARERLGGALLAAAVAVKASVALLVPIFVSGAARRGRVAMGVLLGLGAAGLVAVAVLGGGLAGFPPALADQAELRSPNSVLHVVGWTLGAGTDTPAIRAVAALALAATLLAIYVRVARGANPIAGAGWATVATLVATTWLMPWYVVWVLPLAALAPGRGLRAAALALSAFVMLMRTPLPIG